MKISVIAPCRNEASHIERFVANVLSQDATKFEIELIVADGLSDDGTSEILDAISKKDNRLIVIRNLGRIVSTGLNRAMELATGDVIVRMDIHTEYSPDYLLACATALRESGAACVGGPWRAKGVSNTERAIAAAFQSVWAAGGAKSRDLGFTGPVDTVYLGAWNAEDLRLAGGFDETLVRNQDDELALRLSRMGKVIWQSESIRSWYRTRGSLRQVAMQFMQYGYWKAFVIKKHKVPASWRHLVPPSFVLGLLVLICLSLFSAVFLKIAAAIALSYLIALIWLGFLSRDRALPLRFLPVTVGAFACMQLGYGIGLIRGIGASLFGRNLSGQSMSSITR